MKSRAELHQELRRRILDLPGVTEKPNAGIHEDAFFIGRAMFMHIHGHGHCDIRLSQADQEHVLLEGKASPHRWAPKSGYVTFKVTAEKDLEPALNLIQTSYRHFAGTHDDSLAEIQQSNDEPRNDLRNMRLFVIGATGRTGREIVQQGLARGHHVTAYVRSLGSIRQENERLVVLEGNVMDEKQLLEALQGQDVVLSTLGPREVFKPSSLMHDSALATTRAMNCAGLKRLVILSASAHFPGIQNRIASFILRNHMRDSLAMEAVVKGSGLDWTIARPPRLTAEEYLTYRSREDAAPRMAFTLSRKAAAAFMLDATEQRKHVRKIVGIAK